MNIFRVCFGAVAFVVCSSTIAADLHVPVDFPTIQDAVDAASNGDTIFVAPGIYKAASGASAVVSINQVDVSIIGTGGADETIIHGEGQNQCLGVSQVGYVTFKGLGFFQGSASSGAGGYIYGAAVTFQDCIFLNCESTLGGAALYLWEAGVLIDGCRFTNNTGSSVLNCHACQPDVTNCIFSYNTGEVIRSYVGGPNVSDCIFRHNTDGPVHVGEYGAMDFTDCEFTDNTNTGHGGAVYMASSASSLDMTRCAFSDNTAAWDGGAIYASVDFKGRMTLIDCTIDGNTAGDQGGGVYMTLSMGKWYGADVEVTGCTFSDNASAEGGGLYVNSFFIDLTPELTDNTFCGNTPDHINGNWDDLGGNTFEDDCPLLGACCTDNDAVCVIGEESTCLLYGGTFMGDGTICADVDCPDCPGDLDGNGTVDVVDLLGLIATWGPCP